MRTKTLKPYLAIILTLAWSVACVQAQFTFSHVGSGETGSITPNAEPGSYTFIGGGDDIWDTSDNFDYAHTTVSGNFDVRVRVESLEFVATWTKAGLMARESLNGDSRMAFNRVTPSGGANDTRFAYRTGLIDAGGPNGGQHEDGSGAPGYPNAWLRLARSGSVFNAYASTDGLNWRLQGSQDTVGWQGGAIGNDLLLGLAVSRHSGADTLATAEFRDYGDATTTPAAISVQPANTTVEEGFAATLSFSAVGGFDIYDIQWRKGGVDIPGATSPTYTTAALGVSDSGGAYSVAIRNKNNNTTATSADGIVTVVPDTTAPTVVSAGVTPGIANRAVLVFSEPVNEGDAENLANYTLAGGTISGAELQADGKTVHLATSALNTSGCKEIGVSGIKDRASTPNTMVASSHTVVYAEGVLRYNEYTGFGGVNVTDLTSNPKFPNQPDFTGFVNIAENPNGGGGQGDNYGGRLVGYLTAPVSGDYRFYIAADDGAVLYLSTDENPANKVAIATEPIWNGFRNYTTADRRAGCGGVGGTEPCENVSGLISLQCGNRYYVEGLWKEGGGGDHMSIAWQTPGGGMPTAGIPGQYLSPLDAAAITLAANLPGDTTISENQNLNLSINITAGTPTWHIQWYKDGAAIPGATAATFTIENAKIPDSGTYHATVQNGLGVTTSRSAVVNVIVDTVPPTLVSAAAPAGNDTQFDLVFSEPVNEADAEDLTKYSLPGVTLNSATLQADNKTVRFTCTSLYVDGCEQITASNIRDQAIPPNTMASGTIGVLAAKGSIRYLQYNDITGVVPANLTTNPKFPNAADRILNVTQFENPAGGAGERDNYGAYFQGYVHPPVSGEYRFYLSADDGAALFLSTDENPANKVQIAAEPIWSGFRQYQGSGAGGGGRVCPGAACNISQPITLQAGCKYYIDFIYKEGGGGDFGSVAWQLPGGPAPANGSAPIQAAFLSPYEIAASIPADQPADATVLEGRFVTFTANIQGSPNLSIKWYRDGAEIAGATGTSYTFGPAKYPEDNGAQFQVIAQNSLGTANSRTATLTVTEDTVPPSLVAAAGSTTFDRVTVTYDEIVADLTAGDEFNYAITDASMGAVNVIQADLLADGKTVLLTLDPGTPLQLNTEYTVTATGIGDISDNVMDIGTATFRSAVEGCGGIVFEAYNAGGGNAVSILTGHPTFPNSPDFRATIPGLDSRLAYPTDVREAYGARMRGVYVPPYSGQWVLYLRSDDASELWFNPNGIDPAGKQRVQQELGCCQAFEALPTAPMNLIGGHPYYIEVLYKEGVGGDYAQVAARQVGSADPLVPIGSRDVGQYAVPGLSGTLTVTGPADQSVMENRIATFSVSAESSMGLPICYQWSRDGSPIPDANGPSYSFRPTLADNGAVFTVRASIVGNVVDSAAATLTVTVDTGGPRVVSAKGSDTFRNAFVTFDEPIDPNTGADEFNYAIPGLVVEGADMMADGVTVRLVTSEQTPGTVYTVQVSGVTDIAATPNVVDPAHSSANFTAFTLSCGLLAFEAYNGIPGVAVADLTSNAKYPDGVDETRYMNTFDTVAILGTTDYRNDYGARVHGVFIPPVSGNWIFYLRSDDASQLYLNPAGIDPAGKILLTEEPACCGPFAAHASTPQALTAGQHYFIEGIYKEGGGGDYIQVAAKLESDPTPPNSLRPISAASLGLYTDPGAAQITVNTQPATQTTCIDPLSSALPTASFTVAASATPPAAPLNSEDFNAGNGGYTVQTDTAFSGPWVYNGAAGVWQADGQAAELGAPMTSRLISPTYSISQAGVVRLTFSHRYSFEGGAWDGGQVRVSVNGGPYTAVPGTAFTEGSYNGTVLGNSASIIHGESGFLGDSPGHGAGNRITSTADIANLNAGDTVSVQFLYAADTNTRGAVPNWEIDNVTLTQGGQPGLPVFIQWQRNNGTGWNDIAGALGGTYSFNPALSDNGAQFRALLSSPGAACTTTAEATLTVMQANTAPKFDLGASAPSNEDAGPQSVAGFANNIAPHSITRTPVAFASTFDSAAGLTLYGIAGVRNGRLELTTPINSANGAAAIDAGGAQNFESLEISWKSYIGDGAGGGADGYSLNIGDNIPGDPAASGQPAEEGLPNSTLTISVDTFNNAELRNPDEGIQLEYRNAEIAFQNIPKGDPGDGNYLRKAAFVDAKLTVDASGLATFTYDGNTISGQIPDYAGIRANRAVFWARTGGANDNQWIDDLDLKAFPFDRSSVESGQQVSFEVSNDNPALFSVQPAISANGTLTYAAAPNACGQATVSVVASDDGGIACNGDDASDAKTFVIDVACVNDCPVATAPAPVTVKAGASVAITLGGTDVDGDALTAAVASNPAHGSLSVENGVLRYSPDVTYGGADSFTFTVSDGVCTSEPATVSITVVPNAAPSCLASLAPADCGVTFPNSGKIYTISVDDEPVCLALDGSGSSDPDGDSLVITWIIDGTTTLTGPLVTTCLAPGCHTITMMASDGAASCQQQLEVCVVSPSEAVEQIIELVESTSVERKNKRPLIVSLKAAKAAFESGEDHLERGGQMLQVFQHKVAAQIARQNPGEAATFDAAAADVIKALECTLNLPPRSDE